MKHDNRKNKVSCLLLAVIFCITAVNFVSAENMDDCISCHHLNSVRSALHISGEGFKTSVHGEILSCRECHTGIMDESHQNTRGSGIVNCGGCHDVENRHGISAVDGKRPACYDCHTRHGILPKDDPFSTVHRSRLSVTCATCHPAASGQTDYLSWFPSRGIITHPKSDAGREYKKDNCLGCHQGRAAHGETALMSGDSCHVCHLEPDGQNALMGVMHPGAGGRNRGSVFTAAMIYQGFLISFLLGGVRFYIRKFSRKFKK